MEVTIKADVSAEFLQTVIVTAVEGGINYWANTRNYQWSFERPDIASVELAEFDEDTGNSGPYILLTQDKIKAALERIIQEPIVRSGIRGLVATAVITDDGGHIDAELADVIVQIAMLGEVRYG